MQITPEVWLAFGAGLVLGAMCIFLLQRRLAGADRERAEQLAAELEETREELDSHREEVAKHFEGTSQLFRGLTEQYTRLYAHLAEGAREFCTEKSPALARGFDGPLLGGNGSDAPGDAEGPGAQEPRAEPRREQANGGAQAQREQANGGAQAQREQANGGARTHREQANGSTETRREQANGGAVPPAA